MKNDIGTLTTAEKNKLARRHKFVVGFFKVYPACLVVTGLITVFGIYMASADFNDAFSPARAAMTTGLFVMQAMIAAFLIVATYFSADDKRYPVRNTIVCFATFALTYMASLTTSMLFNIFALPLCLSALIVVALVKFLLDKTKFGYEMKAVGFSNSASRYAGIHVGKSIVLTMVISGALAGLAGVTYYLGYFGSIQPRTLCDTGFDAIAVSLLGNSNPVGIIFSSFLITLIDKGSTYMSSTAGVQAEIADVITGVILLFCACTAYIKYRVARMEEKEENR